MLFRSGRIGIKVWIYKGEVLSQTLRTTPRTMDLSKPAGERRRRDDRRGGRRDDRRGGQGGFNREGREGGGRPQGQGQGGERRAPYGSRPQGQGGFNRGPRPAPQEGGKA